MKNPTMKFPITSNTFDSNTLYTILKKEVSIDGIEICKEQNEKEIKNIEPVVVSGIIIGSVNLISILVHLFLTIWTIKQNRKKVTVKIIFIDNETNEIDDVYFHEKSSNSEIDCYFKNKNITVKRIIIEDE